MWSVGTFGVMVVFWGAIVALVFVALRFLNRPAREDQAMKVLRERLAKGEIDAAEFEAKRKLLAG
jgi:uncharacterized membrane protein